MNSRKALEYLARNYGENGFDEGLSGHEVAFRNQAYTFPYNYDPAEDGPEVGAICSILASGALAEDKRDYLLA